MTPRPPVLTSREMQIMHMLREDTPVARVIQVGVYRGIWTADDVHAVLRRLERPRKPAPRRRVTAPVQQHRTAPPVRYVPRPPIGTVRDVTLTPAQVQVLDGLCRGLANTAIAAELVVSMWTVRTYVTAIQTALGADNRVHAVVLVWSEQVRVSVDKQRRSAS